MDRVPASEALESRRKRVSRRGLVQAKGGAHLEESVAHVQATAGVPTADVTTQAAWINAVDGPP